MIMAVPLNKYAWVTPCSFGPLAHSKRESRILYCLSDYPLRLCASASPRLKSDKASHTPLKPKRTLCISWPVSAGQHIFTFNGV
jgi:hypothetical protein